MSLREEFEKFRDKEIRKTWEEVCFQEDGYGEAAIRWRPEKYDSNVVAMQNLAEQYNLQGFIVPPGLRAPEKENSVVVRLKTDGYSKPWYVSSFEVRQTEIQKKPRQGFWSFLPDKKVNVHNHYSF